MRTTIANVIIAIKTKGQMNMEGPLTVRDLEHLHISKLSAGTVG